MTPPCAGLLKPIGSGLELLKFTFNAKNFVGYFRLSLVISTQFIIDMRVAARNREKFTKTPYFEDSRSFKVMDVDILKKLVACACYNSQHVRAYLQPFLRQTSQ